MDLDLQDDLFADAELDDLPDNAFEELEERAIFSTQQHPSVRAASSHGHVNTKVGISAPESGPEDGEEEDEVINLNARPPLPSTSTSVRKRLDDATQREQWRQQRYGAGSSRPMYPAAINSNKEAASGGHSQPQQFSRPSQTAIPVGREPPSQSSSSMNGDDKSKMDRLLAKVRELEQERASLKSQAEEAKSASLSRAGEIAIVRANHAKAAKEFERRMAVMQKAHADEISKQKSDLEAARKERDQIATSNKFLEHDLAQETERARNLRKTLKDGSGNAARNTKAAASAAANSPLSTPKKTAGSFAMRDGFNDDEVVLISPSKAHSERLTKGAGTPRAGAKRKRPTAEKPVSPVTAAASLDFEQSHSFTLNNDTSTPLAAVPTITAINHARSTANSGPDEKFEFLKLVLNHRCSSQSERSLEFLSALSFKTPPVESLSSKIYDQINNVPSNESLPQLRARFCHTVLDLWARCLQDKFYEPLYELVELLQYVLITSPSETSTSLISRIVKLSAETADLVALPRAKSLKHQGSSLENPADETNAAVSTDKNINPWDYLQLLHLVALNASSSHASHGQEIETFWKAMEYDFVLLMLHRAQPLNQIILMLNLLGTSTLASSFGAIYSDVAAPQQRKRESDIVDRLTVLLFETSIAPSRDSSPVQLTLFDLRYSVLSLLREICSSTHGGALLASHRLVIGRLVRFLHDGVLSMYSAALNPPLVSHTNSSTNASKDFLTSNQRSDSSKNADIEVDERDTNSGSDQIGSANTSRITAATLVNETVLILAHLTTVHASRIRDIRSKLGTIPSGQQKYLVALSRVAFAEGLTDLENGIDAEASEAAHGMLDEILSPEEGEEVIKVFSSGSVSASIAASSVPVSAPASFPAPAPSTSTSLPVSVRESAYADADADAGKVAASLSGRAVKETAIRQKHLAQPSKASPSLSSATGPAAKGEAAVAEEDSE